MPTRNDQRGTAFLVVLLVVAAAIVVGGVVYGFIAVRDSKAPAANTNTSTTTNANVNATSNTNVADTNEATNINSASNTNTANTNTAATTNTSNATEGWKTYTDTQYGFTIQYPMTWSPTLYTTDFNGEGSHVIAFTYEGVDRLPFITVKENWSVEQEVGWINQRDSGISRVDRQEKVTINGQELTRLRYTTAIGSTPSRTVVQDGTTLILFDELSPSADWDLVIGSYLK